MLRSRRHEQEQEQRRHKAPCEPQRPRVDVHGGWYDASGDVSKYLSHLSEANYMNPQQSPMAVWVFLEAVALLRKVKSGRLRALGCTGEKRSLSAPEVPTIAEAGLPGFEANNWDGMLFPAGTPRAIVDRLNAIMNKALATPEVLQRFRLAAQGKWPGRRPPPHLAKRVAMAKPR